MKLGELRKKLLTKQVTLGTWAQIPSSEVAHILGRGFDWVVADLEHGAFNRSLLPDFFRAIEMADSVPIARLAENTRENIKSALDSGAQGLIFPMIENYDMLEQAISWSLYPTYGGTRGVGFCAANHFGASFDGYNENIAGNILLVAQIEHIHAVQNLDKILLHPRLDAILVGPYDLSGSMGLMGKIQHLEVQDALNSIDKKAQEHSVPMGLHIVNSNPQELQRRIHEGYTFIAYGIDTVFLWEHAISPYRGI